MTAWIAISYGALDIRGLRTEAETEVDYMLLPVDPGPPIGLTGEPAELWLRLVNGPVEDAELGGDERRLVREFAEAGIASQDPSHPARVGRISRPWLSSPLHEMVYALMQSLARDNGIDIVFIKGPVLHRQGLREREHSGDVDLWADPERIDDLIPLLDKWGWRVAPDVWQGTTVNHSVAFVPVLWGCELDVHRHLPGCALDDATAFGALQSETEPVQFAGVEAPAPNLQAHTVITALNQLRPERGSEAPELTVMKCAQNLAAAGEEAIAFSDRLRATAVLSPVLGRAFPDRSFEVDYAPPRNWTWRAHRSRLLGYASALLLVPLGQRPKLLARLIWPSADVVASTNAHAGINVQKGLRARLIRLRRGIFK